jgi:hypothetical protein
LELAIQFGVIGVAVLYAVWIAQLLMFQGVGLAAWLGQGVVTQTIVGALFLSYMLDFSSGWLYVFGVGVLGGMCARPQAQDATLPHWQSERPLSFETRPPGAPQDEA